jgi:hypothetical protein
MRARLAVLLILAVSLLAATGCGDDEKVVTGTDASGATTTRTVPNVRFAKTQFVLHTGLAIGAFRRWIYRPWKAGTLQKGADGRTAALVKAAAAGAFTANELRLARNAALSDDKLRGLGDRLGGVTDRVKKLVPGLEDGSFGGGDIGVLMAKLGGLTALAQTLGVDVKELAVPKLPGS